MKLSKAKLGDYRTVIRFAYFPTRMSNAQWIWLEKFRSEERYDIDFQGFCSWHVIDREELKY